MKIAIIGSRPEYASHRTAASEDAHRRDVARSNAIDKFLATLPIETLIVSGGANGADDWADHWAERRGFQRVIFPAAWNGQAGKGAGHRRNALIAEYADRCVAFYGAGKSDGTDGCVAMFRKLGKPVECRDWRGEIIER